MNMNILSVLLASCLLVGNTLAYAIVSGPSEVGKLGAVCNLSIHPARACALGFVCNTSGRPGASGHCVEVVGINQRCGGSVEYPAECELGLECFHFSHVAGAFGVCRSDVGPDPAGKTGAICNYSIHPARTCALGYKCKTNGRPGASGHCIQVVGLNQQCGGSIEFPAECAAGMRCVQTSRRPGAFGICRFATLEGDDDETDDALEGDGDETDDALEA